MYTSDLNNKPMTTKKLVLYYTLLFAVIAAGVFSVFMLLGKSFIMHGDGFRQGYFWVAEIKHLVSSVVSGEGLPQWNWSRGLGMQYLYRADPFNLLAAAFPLKYFEFGLSMSFVLKLYCGGLAYLFFAREVKMSNFQCILGPILYIFSTWFVNVTMIQSSFIFIAFMLPLTMLSIERIYRGKSPVLFILTVAYFLIRDAYLAYMAAIVAILFMLLRYFAFNDKFNISDYLKNLGRFILYGLTGGLLSAAFSLQFILATMRASTVSPSSGGMDLFVSNNFLIDFGKELMTFGHTTGYTYIGLPIMAILVLPIAVRKVSLKNTSSLMTCILLAMTLFPFFSHMFNGFSYSTGRWFVIIVFFASWATMECFDIRELAQKKNIIIIIIWLVILAIWTIGFEILGITGLSLRGTAFILLNLAAGAALIFVIGAFRSGRFTITQRQIATICISGLVLIVSWSMSFYLYQNKFISVGETARSLDTATQKASTAIEDDGFYRVDQVDWLNCHQAMEMPDMESLWWQSKSVYVYDSFTSSKQLTLNKYLGNNYGYLMRVYLLSNDNRMGLDFLHGVKYFLGDNANTGLVGSDNYAGYGFSYMDTLEGVNILQNKYDSGLGFAYDKYISESEFLKLSRPEREQAILQAAVLPDDKCNQITGDITEVKSSDIETDVKDVKYDIIATDGLRFTDHSIITEKEKASFTIRLEDVSRSQLIVSLENFVKDDDHSFTVTCENGKIKEVVHTGHSNQCIPDIRDFDMNMGYTDGIETLKITINHAGEYSLDSFHVTAMSVENYDRYAQKRLAEKFEIEEFDSSHVKGEIDVRKDGLIYFSIPQYTNWNVYIDGKKAEKIEDVNIAFMGAEVSKGHHEVELKYNNPSLLFGIPASVFGLLITITIGIAGLRRRRSSEGNSRWKH